MSDQKQPASSSSKSQINACRNLGSNHWLAEIKDEFPVMINDQPIPGVKLDGTLNWDEHTDMVCKKVGEEF